MDFDLLLLAKERSTKGMLIRCLAAHQQLSLVQLHGMLRSQFQKKISYQAIRQAVEELVDNHVLLKHEKHFSLNPHWVLDLRDVVELLERSIKKRPIRVVDKQTTQVQLKNLDELGHFILFGLDHKYFDMEKKGELYLQLRHLWIPFTDPLRRERLTTIFKENPTRVVVQGNTAGDKMLSRWYKKYGQVMLGVHAVTAEYIVHGDTIVQIFMPQALRKKMDEVYRLRGLLRTDLFRQLSEMTYTAYNIQLVITRNAAIAQQVKEQIQDSLKA